MSTVFHPPCPVSHTHPTHSHPQALAFLAAAGGLRSLLDFSLMRHQDRDAVVDALCNCRLRQQYDMALAWDTRVRCAFRFP